MSSQQSFSLFNGKHHRSIIAAIKNATIHLGEMAKLQMQKIEELTLYILQQNKRIENLEKKVNGN